MDRIGHQLLADARFARDQYGEIAAGDDFDLFGQMFVRLAATDHFAAALATGLPVGFRALPFLLARASQRIDALHHADGRGCEAQEGLQ